MEGVKGIFQSRTVQSNIAGLVVMLVALVGYKVSPEDIQNLIAVAGTIGTAFSMVSSMYYRVKATNLIGTVAKPTMEELVQQAVATAIAGIQAGASNNPPVA